MFQEKTYTQKMDKTFEVFLKELSSLRRFERQLNKLMKLNKKDNDYLRGSGGQIGTRI